MCLCYSTKDGSADRSVEQELPLLIHISFWMTPCSAAPPPPSPSPPRCSHLRVGVVRGGGDAPTSRERAGGARPAAAAPHKQRGEAGPPQSAAAAVAVVRASAAIYRLQFFSPRVSTAARGAPARVGLAPLPSPPLSSAAGVTPQYGGAGRGLRVRLRQCLTGGPPPPSALRPSRRASRWAA